MMTNRDISSIIRKLEQNLIENIHELSEREIFTILSKNYSSQYNPVIKNILDHTFSLIDSEG